MVHTYGTNTQQSVWQIFPLIFFIFSLKIRKKQITMETVQKEEGEGGRKDTGFPSSAS